MKSSLIEEVSAGTSTKAICYSDFNKDGTPEWITFQVKDWTDYPSEDLLKIITMENGTIFINSNNCTIVEE